MSGQLVGEVIAASDELRARGLKSRSFYALIAIAEKAETQTRQGSVRWDHLRRMLWGASKRTAERAVEDLKQLGLVVIVKPGFNNNHGRACAPIYEIRPLTDADSQVSGSVEGDADSQVSGSVSGTGGTDTDKSGGRYRQIEDRYRHPGVVLDVSIDGPIDGGRARDADEPHRTDQSPPPTEPPFIRGPFGPRCRDHVHDPRPPSCPGCRDARLLAEAEDQAEARRHAAELEARRHAREACALCDEYGIRLDDPTIRCDHTVPPVPPARITTPPPPVGSACRYCGATLRSNETHARGYCNRRSCAATGREEQP